MMDVIANADVEERKLWRGLGYITNGVWMFYIAWCESTPAGLALLKYFDDEHVRVKEVKAEHISAALRKVNPNWPVREKQTIIIDRRFKELVKALDGKLDPEPNGARLRVKDKTGTQVGALMAMRPYVKFDKEGMVRIKLIER